MKVLYITSAAHRPVTAAMRALPDATPAGVSQLVVCEGGAIGYQLLELAGGVEDRLVDWPAESLS